MIITQVCRALTKAHSLQIVHRDLKPDNVFLVRDDDREIAKVLDFGIAKSNMGSIEGSNTKTGAMLGTPYYMSPEQAQGVKSVDYRSDLWSLAVIVYQCVTGRLPFESEALGDLLMKIIVQPLPVPSQWADVSAGFDAWWARASSRDPAGRFQSAKEFAESLQMVFGASLATDVMDRGQLRGALGQTPQPGMPRPLMLTPAGAQGNGAPPPGFAGTTEPDRAHVRGRDPRGGAVEESGIVVASILATLLMVGVGVAGFAMKKGTPPANASAPPPVTAGLAASAVGTPPTAVAPVVAVVPPPPPPSRPLPCRRLRRRPLPQRRRRRCLITATRRGRRQRRVVAPPPTPKGPEPKAAEKPKPAAPKGPGDLGF